MHHPMLANSNYTSKEVYLTFDSEEKAEEFFVKVAKILKQKLLSEIEQD